MIRVYWSFSREVLMKTHLVVVMAAVMLLFPGIASAEKFLPPPKGVNETVLNSVKPTLESSPVSKILLPGLTVELERTTLSDIQKYIGVGTIRHIGDAAGSTYWLCYAASFNGHPERIWFSSGEMGGNEHSLLSVDVVAGGRDKDNCPQLPKKSLPVSSSNGLWLGSSSKQLKGILGRPSGKGHGWWIYSYEGKSVEQSSVQLDIQYTTLGTLMAKIDHGKIVALSESQITAN